jgi:hypothetical protein
LNGGNCFVVFEIGLHKLDYAGNANKGNQNGELVGKICMLREIGLRNLP